MEATAIRARAAPARVDWLAIARDLGPRFAARAAAMDEEDLFVSENFAELKASGLIAAGVPAELGGGGASHAELGTVDDFKHLIAIAANYGMEVAMDLAIQCSPDHPWATEHPEWFKKRPDGTIQYDENPPKKYQDIY